jgi:GDP-D-mannose dehydratase
MKQILVTGSSGLVGTHLVNKLLNKGYKVIGVDFKQPTTIIDSGNFTVVNGIYYFSGRVRILHASCPLSVCLDRILINQK